ncbi:DUF262 domain-containing protein [Desulfonema magnum]|uniref:DUF262 n=1 Tax=Desulfonema magnum TaxID=45655 RepID=A0A975BGB1_9BACT|nr:DUF262 domain-containing protein [Desulfonema magnum]QTA84982.1 DUF262 [Desulfonema magnum]
MAELLIKRMFVMTNKMEKLIEEVEERAREYQTEFYVMSVGELMNLYRDDEIIINPDFQGYFRWTNTQKTRLVESFLLGIPIPSLFVFEREDGIWELVDGLQRFSTILQFAGLLKGYPPLILESTKYLPSLEGTVWEDEKDGTNSLPPKLKLSFKRTRVDFTIIKKESGDDAKFEVFRRLNTGGSFASDQEIRNCTLVMMNKDIHNWFQELANDQNFSDVISITQRLIDEQYHVELVLRYLACCHYPYNRQKDVRDYLTDAMEYILKSDTFDFQSEKEKFEKIFTLLNNALGEDAFKKFDGKRFKGKFLESAYEAITVGLGTSSDDYETGQDEELVIQKIQNLWKNKDFLNSIGSGTNAKVRLPRIIPFAKSYFKK